jgi:hypothetical protein
MSRLDGTVRVLQTQKARLERRPSAWLIVLLGTVSLFVPSTGSAAVGASGTTGVKGATGAAAGLTGTGITGATGSTGRKGATGAEGATGAKGAIGATGAAECTRHLDDGATGRTLPQDIELTPAPGSAQRNVNFGSSRTTKTVKRVTFASNKQLPDSLTPKQLSFDAVLSRAGDTLESTDFPDPTFTEPRITPDRKSIKFTVCLNPGSTPPGKYVGSVTLSGPPGISAASLSLTINEKKSFWYWAVRGALALAVAFALLILKDAAAYRKANATLTTTPSTMPNWGESLKHPLADLLWWATTVFALGAAFGTLYALYKGNAAWGSEGFSDFTAMIGATFAAVGGHTIISTLTPS